MRKGILIELFAFCMGIITSHTLCKKYIAKFEYQNDILEERFHRKNEELQQEREKWRHREEWHMQRFHSLEFDRNRYREKWEMAVKMRNIQNGKGMADCLLKKGYKNIAVYGCGEIGEWLIDQIICDHEHKVQVLYIIDQKKNGLSYKGIPILLNANTEQIDAVIVTIFGNIDEIEEYLMLKDSVPLIELKDIIQEENYKL